MATFVMVAFYYVAPELFSPVPLSSIPVVLFAAFLTTFLIPLLSILILKMTSRVSSLELTKREERILPFASITLFYGAATYMFYEKLQLGPPLTTIMILVSCLILLLSLITLKFKISIHAAGSWGVAGLFVAMSFGIAGQSMFIPVICSVLIAGAVSWSRLALGYHTSKEVWAGSFLGFLFTFFLLLLFA